jgi:hypothetical protein
MLMHLDVMLSLASDRHRELVAEAGRERLLSLARDARKARKGRVARGRPAGTLASCEPSAVVPVR